MILAKGDNAQTLFVKSSSNCDSVITGTPCLRPTLVLQLHDTPFSPVSVFPHQISRRKILNRGLSAQGFCFYRGLGAVGVTKYNGSPRILVPCQALRTQRRWLSRVYQTPYCRTWNPANTSIPNDPFGDTKL